jgi:subtilisin family serine protease
MLADVKSSNKDAIISPYFKFKDGDKIGLSNFFYVKLKTASDTVLLNQIAAKTKSIIVEQDPFMPLWHVLSITEQSNYNAMEAANIFYESGLFQASEPNLMVDVVQCVNDTYFTQQWGLRNTGQYGGTSGIDIKACDAWQISTGNNITVAVIDEGIDLTHPDLLGNIHPLSFDTENRSSPSIIRGSHGTACAGIAGAIRNNTEGIAGVAPNSRLMSISRFLGNGSLLEPNIQQDLATGINWAWQNGADVISNSWGHNALQGSFITDAVNNAVTQGRNGRGCVVVFASGNENASTVNYPASLPNVIAVGAISPCGQRKSPSSCDRETTWGSNYGTALDIVAPGVLIPTTDRQGGAGYNPNIPIP